MGKKGWVAGRTPGGGGTRKGTGGAWATEAGAEACEQQGRDESLALGARMTRGAARSCIAQKRRN